MRIEHVVYFQYDELTDEAKGKARDWYRDATASDNYPLDEMVDSFKALFKAAGIKITDWSLGAYNQNNFVRFDMENAGELTGKRAMAWLENNLFSSLRMTQHQFKAKQKDYMSYGDGYRVGKIKPCPLTGMCYDEDLIDDLKDSIHGGMSLKESFAALADKVGHMIEDELEYQSKDEQVEESIRANEYEFLASGERA